MGFPWWKFKRIINKLGYLKKLGVSILYLSPIFEASSNHKYDTGDYKKIDPMFGDEDTFKELIDKAKEKGISIVLDGVFSHTGADSKYFNMYGNYNSLEPINQKNLHIIHGICLRNFLKHIKVGGMLRHYQI